MDTPERFVADLAKAGIGRTFNQYASDDPDLDRPGGAEIRRRNLIRYIQSHDRPALLLVGEAPSYRGCRFSGIAFTSERRHLAPDAWSSINPRGWTEPSATIVHRVLERLGIGGTTMLSNIVPTHPADDRPLSNRTSTQLEIAAGFEFHMRLVALVRPTRLVAIGKSAQSVLSGVPAVRHPANGGATVFADQLAAIVAGNGHLTS